MSERVPILFLHGAFGGPEVWRFVAPWFQARGHRIAVPALPGRGDPAARLRDYVRAARAAAEALGPGRPVVVGHSLGGLVAQHLAAERRVAGAALIASPGPFGLGPSLIRLAGASPHVLAALMLAQAGAGALVGPALARAALFTEATPEDWIRDVAPPPGRESPAALVDGLTWDVPVWPLARGVPMLAVLGDADAFVPRSDLWAVAAAYGAETEVLGDFGHGLPIDPRWKSLAWRLNAWLDERGVGAAASRGLAPA